jgi:hypothetical protein
MLEISLKMMYGAIFQQFTMYISERVFNLRVLVAQVL